MKKIVFLTTLIALLVLSITPALALDTGIQYGTATGLGTKDLREGVMSIIQVALSFLGIIAIVIMLYGGFVWMTAGGNEEKVSQAKKIISAGIIGLIIIFISFALAQFVITQLLCATGVPGATGCNVVS